MKWRFAGRFLLAFVALAGLWFFLDIPTWYREAILLISHIFSPGINGWYLHYASEEAFFTHANKKIELLLDLNIRAMGLLPLLSLILATPGQGRKQLIRSVLLGSFLFFLLDVFVVLVFPWLLYEPNPVKDIIGFSLGILSFVAAPLVIWFGLTYSVLQEQWRLDLPSTQQGGENAQI